MGKYVRKFQEKVEEEEEIVDVRKRMKIVALTTPFNVYELKSRRRINNSVVSSLTSNQSETTSFEDANNFTGICEVVVSSSSSELPPLSCSSSNISASFSSSSEIVENCLTISESSANFEVDSCGVTSSKLEDCNNEARKVEKKTKVEREEMNGLDHPVTNSTVQIKSMMMPSNSEIDDFFSSAEKNLQKRFSDKYNFDIVKDVPLEGRYEWVQIKQ